MKHSAAQYITLQYSKVQSRCRAKLEAGAFSAAPIPSPTSSARGWPHLTSWSGESAAAPAAGPSWPRLAPQSLERSWRPLTLDGAGWNVLYLISCQLRLIHSRSINIWMKNFILIRKQLKRSRRNSSLVTKICQSPKSNVCFGFSSGWRMFMKFVFQWNEM